MILFGSIYSCLISVAKLSVKSSSDYIAPFQSGGGGKEVAKRLWPSFLC